MVSQSTKKLDILPDHENTTVIGRVARVNRTVDFYLRTTPIKTITLNVKCTFGSKSISTESCDDKIVREVWYRR